MMLPGMIPVVVPSALSGIIMTAGTDGTYTGYSDGTMLTAIGSISSEPLAGETMLILASDPFGSGIYFAGDIAASLATMTLYIDDNPWSLASASYSGGYTVVQWSGTRPIFTNGNSYNIRIE